MFLNVIKIIERSLLETGVTEPTSSVNIGISYWSKDEGRVYWNTIRNRLKCYNQTLKLMLEQNSLEPVNRKDKKV